MLKRKLVALVGAAAAVALVTGCAGSGSDPGSSGESGGTLVIGMLGNTTESLDPHFTLAASADLLRAAQLFDGLSAYLNDGSVELSLAEEMTPNEDSTEWTVKLREGVTFHDGKPLTADDVIFTINRILDPAEVARGAGQLGFMTADQVSKVDDLTVLFTFDAPYGPFAEVWASNYLRIVPEGFDPANPIGTGPFKYESFTAGQESVFVRNEDYWNGAPKLDAVEVVGFADEEASINALISGQIDLSYDVPLAQIEVIEKTPGLNLLVSESGQYLPIVMNQDVAPFDDERVRLAMKLIADRQELIDNAWNGQGRIANDWISAYGNCEQPDIPQRLQDIDEAKRLLAETGNPDLVLDLYTTPGTSGMIETAVVFAEQAKEAGVTVNVHQLEQAAYLERYTEWPMAVDFYASPYLELISLTLLPGGPANAGHWNDAEFNAMSAELFATSNQDAQCQIIAQMKQIEHDRGVNIVWGWGNVSNAYSDRVEGLQPDVRAMAPMFLNDVTVNN